MADNRFMRVEEVAKELDVSKSQPKRSSRYSMKKWNLWGSWWLLEE